MCVNERKWKMATFKQVPQSFLFEKLVRFWGNMVKNYQGIVCEDNFFRILNRHFAHEKAVKLIEATYTPDEVKEMSEAVRGVAALTSMIALTTFFSGFGTVRRSARSAVPSSRRFRRKCWRDIPSRGTSRWRSAFSN